MKHEKTVIYFESKGKSYRVEYGYNNTTDRTVLLEKNGNESNQWFYEQLQARVYIDNDCIRLFSSIPSTKTKNPTKSQAKELITKALKEIKDKQQKKQKSV
jgi:hypothetical protein